MLVLDRDRRIELEEAFRVIGAITDERNKDLVDVREVLLLSLFLLSLLLGGLNHQKNQQNYIECADVDSPIMKLRAKSIYSDRDSFNITVQLIP